MPIFAVKFDCEVYEVRGKSIYTILLSKVESSRGKFESIRKFFEELFCILYLLDVFLHFFEYLIDEQLESIP